MTLREIMAGYPGSKDIRLHPYYQGKAGQWVWKVYHHRFTRAGRWFLGATLLMLFIVALFWSLDTQTYVLTLYSLGLWLVSSVALLPVPVRVRAQHAERIAAGELLQVEVEVTHTGRRPLPDLVVQGWGLPIPVDAQPEEGVPLGLLQRGEQRRVRMVLACQERGVYTLGGYRVRTDFPFGLLSAYRVIPCPTSVIVHPVFTPIRNFALPSGRRYQPGGIAMASQVGDSFEYLGNREWREGDSPRDIDWRATARHANQIGAPLIVREWREEYFLRVGVVLDTYLPELKKPSSNRLFQREMGERLNRKEQQALQEQKDNLERAISVCAAVSDSLARQDYIVDLFAAGPTLHHLTAGRSLAYREQILDILSCVESSPEEPFSVIAPRLEEDLDRLTTVICIVLDWDEPRQRFVSRLREHGVGVKIIWVARTEDAAVVERDMQVLTPRQFQQPGGVTQL